MLQLHDISQELTAQAATNKYKDCCALILRSEGSSFCAGADFHLASSISSPEQGVLMAELMTNTLTRLRYVGLFVCVWGVERRRRTRVPSLSVHSFVSSPITHCCRRAPLITVATLGGPAMGGGAELATTTDFRVMSTNAKIHFVQTRMGVSCGWGGTSRLVKVRTMFLFSS